MFRGKGLKLLFEFKVQETNPRRVSKYKNVCMARILRFQSLHDKTHNF